jgi:hypothetical protein
LQRKRKFLLLVNIVLHAVPEVSVHRLDRVKLEGLKKLATGSVDTVKVKRTLSWVEWRHRRKDAYSMARCVSRARDEGNKQVQADRDFKTNRFRRA